MPAINSRNLPNKLSTEPLKKLVAGAIFAAITLHAIAGPSVFPTGTTRYDPTKAFNSYVLFTGGDNIAHLIDLDGNSVLNT